MQSDKNLPLTPAWVRCTSALIRRLPAGRYRLMNWLCQDRSDAFWTYTSNVNGAQEFICDLRDSIAREVCFTGVYEPQETAVVKRILGPGNVFVDVGANWGYFTLLAAYQVERRGRVISLEPDPRLFLKLQENILRNGLEQVTPLNVAAADVAGTMSLAGFDEAGGNFGLSRITTDADGGGPVYQVAARPLDDILDDLGILTVTLLKMDIEGAEGMALRGLTRSLATHRVSRVLLELHPAQLSQNGDSATSIIAELDGAGYRPWRIDHSQRATRSAAYQTAADAESFLHALQAEQALDEWPHLLWVAPGQEVFR